MKSHVSKSKRVATLGRGVKWDKSWTDVVSIFATVAAVAVIGRAAEKPPTAMDKTNGLRMAIGMSSLLLDRSVQTMSPLAQGFY